MELEPLQSGWKSYWNERFGYEVIYPASLKAGPTSLNGAGKSFFSKKKEFQLSTGGHNKRSEETLADLFNDELKERGKAVQYKVLKKSWFVISGVEKSGQEFYIKEFVGHGIFVGFTITYPHAKSKIYNPVVTQIEKSFVPFTGGGYDVDH